MYKSFLVLILTCSLTDNLLAKETWNIKFKNKGFSATKVDDKSEFGEDSSSQEKVVDPYLRKKSQNYGGIKNINLHLMPRLERSSDFTETIDNSSATHKENQGRLGVVISYPSMTVTSGHGITGSLGAEFMSRDDIQIFENGVPVVIAEHSGINLYLMLGYRVWRADVHLGLNMPISWVFGSEYGGIDDSSYESAAAPNLRSSIGFQLFKRLKLEYIYSSIRTLVRKKDGDDKLDISNDLHGFGLVYSF